MRVITLLTDFGLRDEFAGVVKGVIYGINPMARIVDLSHGIDPQDIVQAAYLLRSAYRYFPPGTIHTAVVDPGVGSPRVVIAARQSGHFFIAPDNGLLSVIWEEDPPEEIVKVENRSLFLQPMSRTFHGRDIFAPVAAHLSLGMALNELGPDLTEADVIRLPTIQPVMLGRRKMMGRVVSVDQFGNLITSLSEKHIERLKDLSGRPDIVIHVGGKCIECLSSTYAEVAQGRLTAMIGSRNYLEIAVNGGSAANCLNISKGASVEVCAVP